MKANHIRFAENLFDRLKGERFVIGPVGGKRIRSKNIHIQGLGQFARAAPDAAKADNAHRLARQFDQRKIPKTEFAPPPPLPIFDRIAMLFGVVAKMEQQGDCKLRHTIGPVNGNVGNRYFTRPGRLDIDHVKPGRQDGNKLEIRKLGQRFGC